MHWIIDCGTKTTLKNSPKSPVDQKISILYNMGIVNNKEQAMCVDIAVVGLIVSSLVLALIWNKG